MTKNIVITYSLKELYQAASDNFFDIYLFDKSEGYNEGIKFVFGSFSSPEAFANALKDGAGCILLPSAHIIEDLVYSLTNFIIVVTDTDGTIWGTFNGKTIAF